MQVGKSLHLLHATIDDGVVRIPVQSHNLPASDYHHEISRMWNVDVCCLLGDIVFNLQSPPSTGLTGPWKTSGKEWVAG